MRHRGKLPGHGLAVLAALALLWPACAVGPGMPRTLPAPAAPSERVGPWGITIALYEPALYGPERPLADLIGEYGLRQDNGKLRGAQLLAIKAQRRLELWVGPRMVKAYRVQLGIVSHGTKFRRGDRMTPEGDYFICSHTGSAFYLALWISYPNLADARRGFKDGLITAKEFDDIAKALNAGRCPPQGTRLGGEILIHGQLPEHSAALAASQRSHPGRLRSGLRIGDADPTTVKEFQDWTEGCIALFNSDIRELYEFVPDGTPVRIVANGPITPPLLPFRQTGR
jgi:hypothetical protein